MKIKIVFSALLCLSLLTIGCKKKKKQTETAVIEQQGPSYLIPSSTADDTLLLYSKTPCFGACPTFRLVVKMNGQVVYEGQKNVERLGKFQGNWSKDQLSLLEDEMRKINFYGFQKSYDNSKVTDVPTMYLGYTKGNDLHKIKCRYEYPNELRELSKWMDTQLTNTNLIQTEKPQNNE